MRKAAVQNVKKIELKHANKSIVCIVEYKKIKNIYIQIKNKEVLVKVPCMTTDKKIMELLNEKKDWIYKSLEKQTVHESRKVDLKSRDYIYVLDKKVPLRYQYKKAKGIKIEENKEAGYWLVTIPENMKSDIQIVEKIEKKVLDKQKEIATIWIDYAMEKYIKLTGLKPEGYSIGRFKSIWGNCSSKKIIKINQNVIWYSPKEIEYVCLHEISHLKYMNHQKGFWSHVEKYMPDYKESIKKMKQ